MALGNNFPTVEIGENGQAIEDRSLTGGDKATLIDVVGDVKAKSTPLVQRIAQRRGHSALLTMRMTSIIHPALYHSKFQGQCVVGSQLLGYWVSIEKGLPTPAANVR
jgi:hypothetical protein